MAHPTPRLAQEIKGSASAATHIIVNEQRNPVTVVGETPEAVVKVPDVVENLPNMDDEPPVLVKDLSGANSAGLKEAPHATAVEQHSAPRPFPTERLYVSNVNYGVTEEALVEFFLAFSVYVNFPSLLRHSQLTPEPLYSFPIAPCEGFVPLC